MQAVARRGNRPDDFCTTLSITDVKCTILPKNFGVSPELRIRVNQEDAFVRVGGMVQEILDLENPEAGPPPSLKVLRPFQGRLVPINFDRSSTDILRLVLLPGDQITFWEASQRRATAFKPGPDGRRIRYVGAGLQPAARESTKKPPHS